MVMPSVELKQAKSSTHPVNNDPMNTARASAVAVHLGHDPGASPPLGNRALVLEPDISRLRGATGETGPRNSIYLATSLGEFLSLLPSALPFGTRAAVHLAPSLKHRHPLLAESARERLERYLVERNGNTASAVVLGGPTTEETLANLPHLLDHPAIDRLQGRFAGVPALVVSAGPSLTDNLEQIKRSRGKALIIAIGQVTPLFRREGVEADLTVVLESRDHHYQFEGAKVGEVPALVLAAGCHPSFFGVPTRHTFIFANCFNHLARWILRVIHSPRGRSSFALDCGGSVSCAAFSLAAHLGCDPIVLVGQDLALREGQHYAHGTAGDQPLVHEQDRYGPAFRPLKAGEAPPGDGHQVSFPHQRKATLTVPGQRGEVLKSTEHLVSFLSWFERQAHRLRRQGKRLYNASTGGAYIEGMEHLSLDSLLPTTLRREYPVREMIARAHRGGACAPTDVPMSPRPRASEPPRLLFRRAAREKGDELRGLADTARRCAQAYRRLAGLVSGANGGEDNGLGKDLQRAMESCDYLEGLLREGFKHNPFVHTSIQQETWKCYKAGDRLEGLTVQEAQVANSLRAVDYYTAAAAAALHLADRLEEAGSIDS